MCLCAFLYFNKFSTVNINYFCNQKKTTMLSEGKNTSFPFNFSWIFTSLWQNDALSIVPHGGGEGAALLSLLHNAVTTSRKLQVPNKYQSMLRASRSVSMATWQGHDTVWVLPRHGDGPAGRRPTLSSLRLPKDHAANGIQLPKAPGEGHLFGTLKSLNWSPWLWGAWKGHFYLLL